MKTIYFSAEIVFNPKVSVKEKSNIIKSLELATEHTWPKVADDNYVSQSFDFASHMKPSIVYLIIREKKKFIKRFNLSVYFIKNLPDKMVKLENNKLTFVK